MPIDDVRPFNADEWTFTDDAHMSMLAEVSAGHEYAVFQLADGRVIITLADQSRPGNGLVLGAPMRYPDALRKLADIADSL